MMLKLYIYGYLNRVPSSRRLERGASGLRQCIIGVAALWPGGDTGGAQLGVVFGVLGEARQRGRVGTGGENYNSACRIAALIMIWPSFADSSAHNLTEISTNSI